MSNTNQWDGAVELYDQNMGQEGDKLNSTIIKPLLFDFLGDYSGLTILDSGCGSGYVTAELAKNAKKVIGTDYAEKFIELCKNKYQELSSIEFIQHDVTARMPFADNTFDTVVSKMVLQYVPEISTFANESYRVTKNSGKLIVIVDHPFHTQFFYAQQLAGKKNPKYPTLHDYFDTREQTKLSLWGKVELTWYPRMVSDYIMAFIEGGYSLKEIREIPETADNIKIPRILGILFEK